MIRFLVDRMTDDAIQIIVIGGEYETKYLCDRIPGELIYKVFRRPVNNEEYVESIEELFRKMDAGEFKKSIMIVDDDPSYLNLVRDWLKYGLLRCNARSFYGKEPLYGRGFFAGIGRGRFIEGYPGTPEAYQAC